MLTTVVPSNTSTTRQFESIVPVHSVSARSWQCGGLRSLANRYPLLDHHLTASCEVAFRASDRAEFLNRERGEIVVGDRLQNQVVHLGVG